jgi:hypothetical protein
MNLPHCDMRDDCELSISMIDDKGFVYCEHHGLLRRDWRWRKCRKLRPHELNRLARGEQVKSY